MVKPLDDSTIENEINSIYDIADNFTAKKDIAEIKDLKKLMIRIKKNMRIHEKIGKTDKTYLDDAYEIAKELETKLNLIKTIKEQKGIIKTIGNFYFALGGLPMLAISWIVLRLIFMGFNALGVIEYSVIFSLDTFSVALVAAIISFTLYHGNSELAKAERLSKIGIMFASPFVALALITIFSNLTLGVDGQLVTSTTSETVENIIAFTLVGASD